MQCGSTCGESPSPPGMDVASHHSCRRRGLRNGSSPRPGPHALLLMPYPWSLLISCSKAVKELSWAESLCPGLRYSVPTPITHTEPGPVGRGTGCKGMGGWWRTGKATWSWPHSVTVLGLSTCRGQDRELGQEERKHSCGSLVGWQAPARQEGVWLRDGCGTRARRVFPGTP